MVAEMRPHSFGPRRIGGLLPCCRIRYLGRCKVIERKVALCGCACAAVATRAQGSGNRGERRNMLRVVPLIELVLVLRSYAHRVQQQCGRVFRSHAPPDRICSPSKRIKILTRAVTRFDQTDRLSLRSAWLPIAGPGS